MEIKKRTYFNNLLECASDGTFFAVNGVRCKGEHITLYKDNSKPLQLNKVRFMTIVFHNNPRNHRYAILIDRCKPITASNVAWNPCAGSYINDETITSIINDIKNTSKTMADIAREYDVSQRYVNNMKRQYGTEKRSPVTSRIPKDILIDAIKLYKDGKFSVADIAKVLGISDQSFYSWIKKSKEEINKFYSK